MAAIGVVIVSWHAGAMLREALGALPHGVPVVVVDNAGEAGLAERIAAVRPDVRLLVPSRNLGFGQACNLGAAALGEVDVLLLNPDACVDGGALALLCAALDADPGLAAVGPAVRGQDGMWERTWGEDPGFRTEWAERRQGRTVAERPREARDVAWLSGCCLLVRRAAWDAVGGFDPGYFLYYEDADICRRLRAGGGRIRYLPEAVAEHARGAVTGTLGHRLAWYRRQGQVRYYRRFNGRLDRLMLGLRLAAVILPRCVAGRDRAFWRALARRLLEAQPPVAEADAPALHA